MTQHELAAPPPGSTLKDLASEMLDYVPMRMGQAIFANGVRVRAPIDTYRALRVKTNPRAEALSSALYVARVREALNDEQWDFRTVPGLVNSTGLPEEAVRAALETPGIARRPWRRCATELFTSADRPVSVRERLSLLDTFIAKRP
jgi:hypothetical protein